MMTHGSIWHAIDSPNLGNANAHALEVCGDSMEPVYREGDLVIVSPNAADLPCDRFVAKNARGELLPKELAETSLSKVRLASINAAHSEVFLPRAEVVWISRIVWVSQ
tara:strand:- start:132 stop:455 length:324 start_codon:yes stop_codon:yes gene_type:complete